MPRISTFTAVVIALAGAPTLAFAQEEAVRSASGGGISVSGWQGQVDARAAAGGQGVKDTKVAKEGHRLHVVTGPAVNFWNPAKTAKGDYTVKATFTEPKYMNLNDHPHPY